MTVPPDHIDFPLVPNDDKDPKRERDATEAVRAAIIALAKQHGIIVHEEPGAIEPDAKENQERAKKIEDDVKPKLIESTAAYRTASVIEDEYRKDGSLSKRKVMKIVEARGTLDSSLGELVTLVETIYGGPRYVIEIACKAVNWVRENVPTRKR